MRRLSAKIWRKESLRIGKAIIKLLCDIWFCISLNGIGLYTRSHQARTTYSLDSSTPTVTAICSETAALSIWRCNIKLLNKELMYKIEYFVHTMRIQQSETNIHNLTTFMCNNIYNIGDIDGSVK